MTTLTDGMQFCAGGEHYVEEENIKGVGRSKAGKDVWFCKSEACMKAIASQLIPQHAHELHDLLHGTLPKREVAERRKGTKIIPF